MQDAALACASQCPQLLPVQLSGDVSTVTTLTSSTFAHTQTASEKQSKPLAMPEPYVVWRVHTKNPPIVFLRLPYPGTSHGATFYCYRFRLRPEAAKQEELMTSYYSVFQNFVASLLHSQCQGHARNFNNGLVSHLISTDPLGVRCLSLIKISTSRNDGMMTTLAQSKRGTHAGTNAAPRLEQQNIEGSTLQTPSRHSYPYLLAHELRTLGATLTHTRHALSLRIFSRTSPLLLQIISIVRTNR